MAEPTSCAIISRLNPPAFRTWVERRRADVDRRPERMEAGVDREAAAGRQWNVQHAERALGLLALELRKNT